MAEPEANRGPLFETPAWPEDPPADWVTFHLAHPGPGPLGPWDPNCAFFWKGRYHLFYIHPGEHEDAYAHVSSSDMVHWRWHPTTLTPSLAGHGMWSGTGFVTKDGRAAIIYHGADGHGPGLNHIAFSDDEQLEEWSPPVPVVPRVRSDQDGTVISNWDPDGWLDGDTYYAIFGGHHSERKPATLHRSLDLANWDYVGRFLSEHAPAAPEDLDITGPNFFPIGDRWMLLCISEADVDNLGCRYYLGDWKDEKFIPEFRARMNFHKTDLFAVESVLTPDGRRVMWAWCAVDLEDDPPQRGIQCLPRELTLGEDGTLRIKPLQELQHLRADQTKRERVLVPRGQPRLLEGIAGDALELEVALRPQMARQVGIRVQCDVSGQGGVDITVDLAKKTLAIADVIAPFALESEKLVLRAFIDKHIVEVFANDRQAMVYSSSYDPSLVHVALLADADVTGDVIAWRMGSCYVDVTGAS